MMIGIAEKVLAAVSGPLIHFIFVNSRLELDEIVKLYSDTGLVLDEAMQEFIANSREAVKASRQVPPSEIADFSCARRAAAELKEGK